MDIGIYEILLGLLAFFVIGYYYFTATFDFWKSRNVNGPKPVPVYGNFKNIMFGRQSLGDYATQVCDQFPDEPMIGIFARRTPILIVKDPECIRDILIKDFSSFANRGIKLFEKIEPLSSHLFSLEYKRWKPLRQNLSPVFTSGKLKEMFYLLLDCADYFETFLDKYVEKNGDDIECRELTAKFATDVIGVCAFGLKMNALDDEDSQFRKMGREVFKSSGWKTMKFVIRQAMPWLFELLGPFMYEKELNEFFTSTIAQTIELRKKNNIKRHDFVDLLIEIKDNPSKLAGIEVTDTLLAAQAFVFFVAGFETSSTTISNALYELALNPEVQKKLREEIMNELNSNEGKLKYERVKNLTYMHKVFCETLRKYPPVTVLMRAAMNDYTFTNPKVKIPKDMKIFIPAYALQRDPKIYPDPDTFDPNRFSEENIQKRHPSFYLPFGDGPRNCIGARFANYQSKVGLITILKNYEVEICDKTCIPYVNDPKGFLLAPVGGIHLKFKKIAQND